MSQFHGRNGSNIVLSNGSCTARRNGPLFECDNGLVFSSSPLKELQVFTVRIDSKISRWSGSIKVGLMSRDPTELVTLPSEARQLDKSTSWILSGRVGCSDRNANKTLDLDALRIGDQVGVQRGSDGQLNLYFNGAYFGVAAHGLPASVWAVVDVFGDCTEVSIPTEDRPQQSVADLPGASAFFDYSACDSRGDSDSDSSGGSGGSGYSGGSGGS